MPRNPIEISDKVEYLSVLDENGQVDRALEPNIPPDLLQKLYRSMVLGRQFDQRLLSLQRQGRIGTFPPITGQEAAQLGAVALLRPSDWMVPSFRETVAEVWRGRSLESIILAGNGFNEGGRVDADKNNLPVAIPVASQVLHAVGLAWAIKYRQKDDVAMAFFGDGATSQGDFHEGLNFAAVYQAPVIFVCQNNQWAISVPRSKQTRSKTLAQKALAYGMPGIQVDGNDILAVYLATREAVERARAGGGPTLIECVTYRLLMHTTADDPKRYRNDEEVEIWSHRDPLVRFEKYLTDKELLNAGNVASTLEAVTLQIQAAVDNAEAQMKQLGNPLDMFDHVYAELPPHLMSQKEALAHELSLIEEDKNHG
ncbi:MAG: pyruvate dehydrogenase (acetyl-transferring) E1 component subunit alpha [Deltaproteobacteria bacterium]|nr:pyruvate dehydrogenase (acetyl-transferring) E1 component subunit alpha [Deltaproteobacteria bacterium]